jgi:hypothetical protein
MNCQKFDEQVTELARGQMMQAAVRTDALMHVEQCSDCRDRLGVEETLTRDLRSVAVEMGSNAPGSELKNKLLAAYRQNQVVTVRVAKGRSRYWLSVAAGILLVLFSVLVVRWQAQKSRPAPGILAVKLTPVDTASTESPLPLQSTAVHDTQKEKSHRNPPVHVVAKNRVRPTEAVSDSMVASNEMPKEVATEFMPIGSMTAASLQDGGQIVRVELPRSALASFGLPVNMERYNEKVKADVVLGVDGLAHAIRFVQ